MPFRLGLKKHKKKTQIISLKRKVMRKYLKKKTHDTPRIKLLCQDWFYGVRVRADMPMGIVNSALCI